MFYKKTFIFLLVVFVFNLVEIKQSFSNEDIYDIYEDDYEDESYEENNNKKNNDPFEKINRKVFNFNMYIFEKFLIPAGNMYEKITTKFIRKRIKNVVSTLKEPLITINSILELDYKNTLKSLATLGYNLTIGVFGLFNPAEKTFFYREQRTFNDTLKFYKIPEGPYLVLPFLGSHSMRSAFGYGIGFYANPVTINYFDILSNKPWIDNNEFNMSINGLDVLNDSIRLKDLYNNFLKKSFDPYIMMREYYYNKN